MCFANIFHSFPPAALPFLFSLLNHILCSFPDLTSPSAAPQALPQPPSLVPEPAYPATLFSCLSTFYPCSFLASIVPTQMPPPPPHISLVASGHFSCTPSSRYLGSTGGADTSMPAVDVPGAKAACRDWKQPGKESPAQPWELQGGACSFIPRGWQITQTLMSPK